MILLTTSANLALMNSVSESLAGRSLYLEPPPFCPTEWASNSKHPFAPLESLFKSDFRTKTWPILEGEWLEIGDQITRVPVFSTNPISSLVKSKKLLWNDCGLAAWLAGIGSEKNLLARTDCGLWLEQAVFQTQQTWRSLNPAKRRIYFRRNRLSQETDFILEEDSNIVALEIKSGRVVGQKETMGLEAFREALSKKKSLVRSVVLYGGQEARALGNETFALPFGWMFPVAETKALREGADGVWNQIK